MNFKYDFVIFDLDGTLLDTSKGILESVKYVIEKHKLNILTHEQLLTFIGPPIQESFHKHYCFDKNYCQVLANEFRERYKNCDLLKAKPYEGIYNVLNELIDNEVVLAVSTYKREDYAKILLNHFDFDKYIKIVHGADNNNELQKKDIIQLSINDYMSDNKKIVYVGDTNSDLLASKKVNIDFIGVNYGFGFSNVSYYANCPKDILLYMR